MKIKTNRLVLREFTMEDLDGLHMILSDAESMRHYPKPFTFEETENWIRRNMERYETDGFGLWGMVLKETGQFIGDCGITMQNICGAMEPEIGYHVDKRYTNHGYASEAARACRDYAFDVLKLDKVYSYMNDTNMASQRVAVKNGMKFIKEIEDERNRITRTYAITMEDYQNLKKAAR
jgi:RimJ/RimL family protein N-acetyltransferase